MIPAAARRLVASALCACAVAVCLAAQTKEPAVKRAALLKLAEPWPDAEAMRERRLDAESRRLFANADPAPFMLTADFKAINKDRRAEGKLDYAGALATSDGDGRGAPLHVKLRTRGHFRLRSSSCSFVPLRVEF